MASTLAMKKLLTSNLLSKLLPVAAAPRATAARCLATDALSDYSSDDDRSFYADRRNSSDFYRHRDSPIYDVFAPLSSIQRLSPLRQILVSPVLSCGSGRGVWGETAKETSDGVYFRFEMPGLGKEDVRVSVENSSVVIKGEGEKESEDEEAIKYSNRIGVDEKMYNTRDIKAEMRNGVLKLFLPKVKEEEGTDVVHVKVQ